MNRIIIHTQAPPSSIAAAYGYGPYSSSASKALYVKSSKTGYSYFGARYYMSDLSIWTAVDPLASKFPNMSPYMYVRGNPIMLVDRWGLEGEPITSKRLSFGKRAGNWFKGDAWKNHANKNIVKNNLYDLRVNKDGSISAKGSTHWNGKNSKGCVSGVNEVDYVFSKSGYDKTIHNSTTSKDEKSFTRWKTIIPGMYNNSLDNFAFQMRELGRKTNPDYATNGGHIPKYITTFTDIFPVTRVINNVSIIIRGKPILQDPRSKKMVEGWDKRLLVPSINIIFTIKPSYQKVPFSWIIIKRTFEDK